MSKEVQHMSEFERNWAANGDMPEHYRNVQDGLQEIRNRLILPEDGRWEIAYGALVMGGSEASVLSEGDPGSGKTAFGNIVLGETVRVDIASTDVGETIDGYKRPTDGQLNEGKLSLDDSAKMFLNEISHLRDTGPLHKYWDSKTLTVNEHLHDIENASIYATTNFPDGRRAKELDSALRSRFGIAVLAGDNVDDIAGQLQGRDLFQVRSQEDGGGLLPPAKARKHIRENLQSQHRLDRQSGDYMADVVKNLNNSGIVQPINAGDARIGQGWQQAERARRLVEGSTGQETAIRPEDLAGVAALALGSAVVLSNKANAEFQDKLGKLDRLSPLEKAVITRRAIAAVAFETVLEQKDFVRKGEEDKIANFMDKRSFASTADSDAINGVITEAIRGNKAQSNADDGANHGNKRKKSRRRS